MNDDKQALTVHQAYDTLCDFEDLIMAKNA